MIMIMDALFADECHDGLGKEGREEGREGHKDGADVVGPRGDEDGWVEADDVF